ncbi:MAG: citrate lyase holo-[acyl-carrier protein] synthase [Clostridiaceae bacterium]|nr:citrate lyase holo-[acyl-carrier protein] synthase [Clostridiaceae bacterium]
MNDKILDDREKRYLQTVELYNIYKKPIICGKINYPGQNKNTLEAEKAFSALLFSLNTEFKEKLIFLKLLEGFDGKAVLAVIDMDPVEVKKRGVYMEENHELGRIFDIDIYVEEEFIGREKMNKSPRRCLICSEDARVCMRLNKHSLEEVIDSVNKLISAYGEKYED